MQKTRVIVCAYNIYDKVKLKYPNRDVQADVNVKFGQFFYWNGKGKLRLVDWGKNSIYAFEDRFFYPIKLWPKN